jgi:hypothetical protein
MRYISITYTLVWYLSFAPEYGWTKCGKCFNIKRQTQLKQVIQGGSIGFNIRGKFYTVKRLRKHLINYNRYG